MKKAFTLIELLVVIAIIAILAAILFPVFAQAKEAAKKTGTVSNAKQIGTALIMYTTDYDDTFPLVTYFLPNGLAINGRANALQIPYPAGWNPTFGTSALALDVQACLWANATLPYTKSTDMAQVNGASPFTISADVNPPGATKAPGTIGFQFNGLLSTYSATMMENPSLVPLATTSHGRINNRGRAYAVPALSCGNANPGETQCQFNPGGAPNRTGSYTQGAIWDENTTAEVHTRSFIAVRTDSSARSYRLTMNVTTGNKNILEPFSGYNRQGAGVYGRLCSMDDNTLGAYYPCFYRPDQDGTRTKWADIAEFE